MAVMDTSTYLALINANEPDHHSALAWFRQAQKQGETISAPVILITEVAAALSRGVGDIPLAHRIVQQLQSGGLVDLFPITLIQAERAATIAADHRIRGCDAIYVALAEQLDEELVTLDKQQRERGANVVITRRP